MKKAVSILLTVLIFFSGINFNAFRNIITAHAATTIDEWTVDAWWNGSADPLNYDLSTTEAITLNIILHFQYNINGAERDYLPGEIEFTFDGIGDVKRNSLITAQTISDSDLNWSVSYDSENEKYTFTNKKDI